MSMEKLREVIKFFLIVWVQTLAWMSFSTQIMIAVELKMTYNDTAAVCCPKV